MMPAEFPNFAGRILFLPFSNSASIMSTHFASRILCRFRHEVNILNPPYCSYCGSCFIYLDLLLTSVEGVVAPWCNPLTLQPE